MPKNVMKLLKPSPHRARNDFDLSHRHIFSANFGELLPISCIETVPGDHIKVHCSDLLRAIPLVTSPFLRVKQHLDVWFVPYRDLWHQFDAFITQKSEPVSSAMKSTVYIPHATMYMLGQAVLAGGNDIIGRAKSIGAEKLLNLLGYGSDIGNKFYTLGDASDSPAVNLFRLAAYNYIWYNEYRQQYYDDGKHLLTAPIPGVDPSSQAAALFNFDYVSCSSVATAQVQQTQLNPMVQMRYRCWKKDLYTGLMPSTQFGNVSTVDASITQSLTNRTVKTVDNNGVFKPSLSGLDFDASNASSRVYDSNSGTYLATVGGGVSTFDVLALRKSEAIQIWRENALRAGNHIKDNMEAHYGIASDFQDHRPKYLGSVSSPLNIGDIAATANSDFSGNTNPNTNVGDIAGKGISSLDEKVFTYDAKEFGVIVCMFSILPETEYNADGIDRMNQLLESEDFFIPEYENLGLEAVSSQNFNALAPSASKVVGYAPRYYGYKTKMDKCFGSFMTGKINAPWCSPNYPAQNAMAAPGVAIPLSTLYVNPAVYDVNFSTAVSVQDQMLCDVYFDVDAVRPMSVVGLPFS